MSSGVNSTDHFCCGISYRSFWDTLYVVNRQQHKVWNSIENKQKFGFYRQKKPQNLQFGTL